jgi:hypothetical protein
MKTKRYASDADGPGPSSQRTNRTSDASLAALSSHSSSSTAKKSAYLGRENLTGKPSPYQSLTASHSCRAKGLVGIQTAFKAAMSYPTSKINKQTERLHKWQ